MYETAAKAPMPYKDIALSTERKLGSKSKTMLMKKTNEMTKTQRVLINSFMMLLA